MDFSFKEASSKAKHSGSEVVSDINEAETSASASARITSYITHLKSRLFKNVVAQFIGLLCLINQAT